MDWELAMRHLTDMEEQYKVLIGMPNVNPFFVLGRIMQLRELYEQGERDKRLYDEIMGIE